MCGKPLTHDSETGLCWDCRAAVPMLSPPWCDRCGGPISGRVDHVFCCADCEEYPPAYDQGRSLYRYEGGIRSAIHALKYQGNFSVIPDLAAILLSGMRTYFADPASYFVVPVPLHPLRRRKRGFNQGLELIHGMAKQDKSLNIWKGLQRVKNTQTQTRCSKSARRENVRAAFRVKKQPPEKVLLIDDVMTTGATLDACAKALKKAGCKEVNTLTIARG